MKVPIKSKILCILLITFISIITVFSFIKEEKYTELKDLSEKEIGYLNSTENISEALRELETKVIIEDGITIGGHPIREIQETLGHSKAYDFIYTLISKNDISEDDNDMLECTYTTVV